MPMKNFEATANKCRNSKISIPRHGTRTRFKAGDMLTSHDLGWRCLKTTLSFHILQSCPTTFQSWRWLVYLCWVTNIGSFNVWGARKLILSLNPHYVGASHGYILGTRMNECTLLNNVMHNMLLIHEFLQGQHKAWQLNGELSAFLNLAPCYFARLEFCFVFITPLVFMLISWLLLWMLLEQ